MQNSFLLKAKFLLKRILLQTLWRYGPEDLEHALRRAGLEEGDVVMVHSSWLQDNGFAGSAKDFLDAIKRILTPSGLLVMTSMPYSGESSREYLLGSRPLKLKNSPSKMGLLSEVMRRGKCTYRSLSPTHPLVVWGDTGQEFIQGHPDTEYPFGEDSPFGKLASLDAKILLVDAPFNNITYNHYLEHRIREYMPAPLYDDTLYTGAVIDFSGEEHAVPVRVLAPDSSGLRIDDKLQDAMLKHEMIKSFKVGNTRFTLLKCTQMVNCADQLASQPLF
jgi:aminoglycoside 3-N-acetyltransferase